MNKNQIFSKIINKENLFKYAVYFQIGCKKDCYHHLENLIKRCLQNFDNFQVSNYFCDYLRLNFPDDFPNEFVKGIRDNNISILTPNKDQTKFFNIFQEFIKK